WFEAENPYAFQEMTEILLETIRKGYWDADEEMRREIAELYARSVARHGESGGLRGGGNVKLERFVEELLKAPGTRELTALLAQYQLKVKESSTPGKGTGLDQPAEEQKPKETEQVRGKEMEKVEERPQQTLSSTSWKLLGVAIAALFLVVLGYRLRRFPKGKSRATRRLPE
ncbi:TPA: cobaltochelatase subunit CobN, partial [Candidatus Poribacteria bacterium]|nr:cobaltochelatase subunit CobN [Candidatus Poribacteria bacterium]